MNDDLPTFFALATPSELYRAAQMGLYVPSNVWAKAKPMPRGRAKVYSSMEGRKKPKSKPAKPLAPPPREERTIKGVKHYRCTKCDDWKPADVKYFGPVKQERSLSGLSSWCRKCVRDSARVYRQQRGKSVRAA